MVNDKLPGFNADCGIYQKQFSYSNTFWENQPMDIIPALPTCEQCNTGACKTYGPNSSQCRNCLRVCIENPSSWCFECYPSGCSWNPC